MSDALQLFMVNGGKAFENNFTTPGHGQIHQAAIFSVPHTKNIMCGRQSVGQADGAVMGNLQALGQFADGNPVAAGKSLDGEQRLVLLRRQAGGVGGVFTETQELPQGVAETGQRLVLGFGDSGHCRSHEFKRWP